MYQIIKRLGDIILAAALLALSSPILLVLILLLSIANHGKPFFFQTRPGLSGKPFRIVKFKTMNDKKDGQGQLLPDSHRITAVGKFIRSTSLDELPQLVNVLKGEMSVVGPRPLLMSYLPLYNDFQKRRHEVKPGITGWAQVNGRNAIDWDSRFALDVWYVENQSFALDLRIIFRTLSKVFLREGVSAEGQATVEYFKGNQS